MTERVDVMVVGAGLAGLAAGAIAARSGCDVLIMDSRVAGGRARCVQRDGYVLNEGAHALYRSGPGAAVLQELGVRVTGGSPPIDRYQTWWDGERHPLPHRSARQRVGREVPAAGGRRRPCAAPNPFATAVTRRPANAFHPAAARRQLTGA